MEYKISDHIKTRASLAVLAIDDYTNRVISDGSVLISVEGAARPVRKSEGYYIFLNLEQSRVDLTIKSERYATEKRSIDLNTLSRTDPVIKIRLKPGRNYALLSGTTCLTGTAQPLSEIRVVCEKMQKYYRLLYDYDRELNKEEIYLFNPEKADMDGKLFVIRGKEDDGRESFHIISTVNRENNLYQMEGALKSSYKKVGTKVFPVFSTKADEKGEYFIPIWNLGEEAVSCSCSMVGSEEAERNITLETGRLNKLNFI